MKRNVLSLVHPPRFFSPSQFHQALFWISETQPTDWHLLVNWPCGPLGCPPSDLDATVILSTKDGLEELRRGLGAGCDTRAPPTEGTIIEYTISGCPHPKTMFFTKLVWNEKWDSLYCLKNEGSIMNKCQFT